MRQALEVDALPRPPSTRRAVRTAAGLGLATGLLSTLPSPLPDIRLGDPAILINATGVPLHAGLVFAALVAVLIWSWQARDPGKCFLAAGLTVIGWLTAVNTADEVISEIAASDLFGTAQGAKESREILGWLAAGLSGGLIGAGFTACGVSLAVPSFRSAQLWTLVLAAGALCGLLLYPAAAWDAGWVLFVPWQAAVAASIAYGLSRT
jgi:hypothetical protein